MSGLFDYDLGDYTKPAPVTYEVKVTKINRNIEDLAHRLVAFMLVALMILGLDVIGHVNSYNWSPWFDNMTQDEKSYATMLEIQYQISDEALTKVDTLTKADKGYFKIQKKCARKSLRTMGYRGSIPSKEWTEIPDSIYSILN